MNIVFNEDFYKRLCNNKSQGYTVSKVLSGKAVRFDVIVVPPESS